MFHFNFVFNFRNGFFIRVTGDVTIGQRAMIENVNLEDNFEGNYFRKT